jgi:aminoglycoside/choline kinase family phosphotransferase
MSDPRHAAVRAFADAQGWDGANMRLIAGDASNRKYYRLTRSGDTALIMDAPPDKGEDTRPFTRIADWLINAGCSAPRILAADPDAGFLLIEDFGDGIFARLFETGHPETPLYEAAIDVLAALRDRTPPPDLDAYDAPLMAELSSLAVTWYRQGISGETRPDLAAALKSRMEELLAPLDAGSRCLVQRDYHAENLIWLPDRQGIARVGLLDFQDAMLGHPAYDLVSILQDARRDVSPALQAAMLERYVAATGVEPAGFKQAYAALGLQRNLRIVGVFARLCLRDGKPHYLRLIPRVWEHVLRDLDALRQPALTTWITETLPSPSDENLAKIAAQCPTRSQP